MAKFIVTIQQTIITEVSVDAPNAADARRQIEAYGVGEAAMDMASNDDKTARIKSVRKSEAA